MAAQTTSARKTSCKVAEEPSKKEDAALGPLNFERLPQLAVRELPKIMAVLHIDGQIEAEGAWRSCATLPGAAASPSICSTGSPGTM